jgi:pimeloyl-ACP methyl ester carboxylesterase
VRTTTYIQHSCTVHEHRFDVPLDHALPVGGGNPAIEVFAREIIRPGGEALPHLVFMQGGPGGRSPRPGDFRDDWIGRALRDYRVVLLDQRGTGQSTRLDAAAVDALVLLSRGGRDGAAASPSDPSAAPPAAGPTDRERARVLSLFRQDQIVRDAELVRRELAGDRPWTSLGQSFGGFINTCYLSLAPEGLAGVVCTGGLPGLAPIDAIYRLTYERTAARNRAYLARHPADERTIREVAAHLRDTEEFLPTGERLSAARFRMIGMGLGMTTRFDVLHYLLEGPWVRPAVSGGRRRLSSEFLREVGALVSMEPLYGVLQEFIYAGATPQLAGRATDWAAERLAADLPGFRADADPLDSAEPYWLTGEHMPRAFFREDPALAPLAGATDELAHMTGVPPVYLPDVLRDASVPVAAAVYVDDMFVPLELSLDTAATIRGARTWVTNEYQHDGLRASGGAVLDHLLALLED